jgi:hypothetical protein
MSIGTTAEPVDNRVAARLAGRLAGKVQASNQLWVAQVVSWMDLVDLCRELDDSLVLTETVSAEDMALHAAVLALALGCGQWLIHQIQTENVDIAASGQSLETLKASLELLRIFQRSRHSDCPPADIESARHRIFHAAA